MHIGNWPTTGSTKLWISSRLRNLRNLRNQRNQRNQRNLWNHSCFCKKKKNNNNKEIKLLPSEYSMWISIKKFILKKCVSVGKVRVINHCNTYHCNTYNCNTYHCNTYHCITYHCVTYHCNTYHCNTYHCNTYHCNTEREPELRRGKIDESFFF